MMFLFSGIRAEVEPVPGKANWFQLTGKRIERWNLDVSDTFGDLKRCGIKVNYRAQILGIHSRDAGIALRDQRFNVQNDPDSDANFGEVTFGVYEEGGTTWMLLAVNQAEYAIFRFLCPREASGQDDEEFDPIEDYRVEAKPAKVTYMAFPAREQEVKAPA